MSYTKKVIVTNETNGCASSSLVLDVFKPNIDIVQAVMAACEEYRQTKEGTDTYNRNCNSFNWVDFDADVPNSICVKYGFRKSSSMNDIIVVDFNEQLITEESKNPENPTECIYTPKGQFHLVTGTAVESLVNEGYNYYWAYCNYVILSNGQQTVAIPEEDYSTYFNGEHSFDFTATASKEKETKKKTKRLLVSMCCQAYYGSGIEVPVYMSLEEAIQYAKEHNDDIPLGHLEYISDSDSLDEENCEFDDEDFVICDGTLVKEFVNGSIVSAACKVNSETKEIVEIDDTMAAEASIIHFDLLSEYVRFDDGEEFEVQRQKTDSGEYWYL